MTRILGLAIIVALALGLAPAQAQTICTVTILANSGDGSLRQHIADPVCDVIAFDPGILPGTITLESQLTIGRSLVLEGPGANQLTLSGNDAVRVFEVKAGNTVAIAGVTIRGGRADLGGGIRNAGTLTVAHSTLTSNTATRGGGIFNGGALTAAHSTISDNAATLNGGGIQNSGILTMAHSTLAGNTATSFGGGIVSEGVLTVAHSTLAGNSAGDGGGIFQATGTLRVKNSIVANHSSGGNCRSFATFTAQGVNLADDATCSGFTEVDDVRLGDLAPNGGPTETHALEPDSPALEAVPEDECTLVDGTPVLTDQRDVSRPQGPRCDVGAFELTVDLEADLLAFFDQAVADGTLVGSGSGASAEGRLNALRHMLATALDLIGQGELEEACGQLSQAYLRADGAPHPPDFVKGSAAPTLAAMILDLMDDLGCP